MFMFQTLKLVPGGEIAGVEYEAIPILLFGLGGLVMVLVPFLDRNGGRVKHLPAIVGVAGLTYIVGMTAWGYHSPVPVFVVLGTALLILLIGLVTGPPRRGRES